MNELTNLEKELEMIINKAKYDWLKIDDPTNDLTESQTIAKACSYFCLNKMEEAIELAKESRNGLPYTKQEILEKLKL